MKKVYVLIIALLCTAALVAQQRTEKTNKITNLTEVIYYYEDGNIQQKGTFNKKKQPHGKWVSYDNNGDKLSVGYYDAGKKIGKWFFWTNEGLREVDYKNNKIVSVNTWIDDESALVSNE